MITPERAVNKAENASLPIETVEEYAQALTETAEQYLEEIANGTLSAMDDKVGKVSYALKRVAEVQMKLVKAQINVMSARIEEVQK